MTYIIIAILCVVIVAMWLHIVHTEQKSKGSNNVQYDPNSENKSHHFEATLKALEQNKVVVVTKEDGIYVRLAGDVNKGEAFRYEFGKVIDFSKKQF
jgi:hypothetical protein